MSLNLNAWQATQCGLNQKHSNPVSDALATVPLSSNCYRSPKFRRRAPLYLHLQCPVRIFCFAFFRIFCHFFLPAMMSLGNAASKSKLSV